MINLLSQSINVNEGCFAPITNTHSLEKYPERGNNICYIIKRFSFIIIEGVFKALLREGIANGPKLQKQNSKYLGRPVPSIFPSYIMPIETSERMKIFSDILPLMRAVSVCVE